VTASQPQQSIFKTSAHPLALFFYLAFRTSSIKTFTTLTCSRFTNLSTRRHLYVKFVHSLPKLSDLISVLLFVVIVLLLAFDFWTVKNVSGRLLCGLRWWNETGPDGESVWVFESADVPTPDSIHSNKILISSHNDK
jgi:hypothetical protein